MGLDTLPEFNMTDQSDLRSQVRVAIGKRRGLSQAGAAREIGVSTTVLSQWINEKYDGDNAAVETKVTNWLSSLETSAATRAASTARSAYVETETARAVITRLTMAQMAPTISVIAGAPGVGKTRTARHYAETNANVHLITLDPMTRSVNNVLCRTLEIVGVDERNTRKMGVSLGQQLAHRRALLIYDEVQHATDGALDMIRSLHDQYEIGVALMGNHGQFARTSTGGATTAFAQFFSRIGARMVLSKANPADVDILLDDWGIEDAQSRRLLHQIAAKPYALRGMDKTLTMASIIGGGAPITHDLLRAAWSQVDASKVAP